MSAKVSIVIPAYNSGARLGRTLTAIHEQTFRDFEIIVVDDGSSDNTAEIVRAYDPTICLLRQDNRGPAVARNRGVSVARGEFIAFCDHDDVWHERHVEMLLSGFDDNPRAAMVFDDALLCDVDDSRETNHLQRRQRDGLVRGAVPLKRIWQCCVASMSVVMIRKSIFDQLGGLHPKIWGLDDLHFYLRLASKHPVYFVDYVGCRKWSTGTNLLPTVGLEGLVKCLEDLRAHHPEVVRAVGGFRYRLRLARKYQKLARRCVDRGELATAREYLWRAYRLNLLNVSALKRLWRINRVNANGLDDVRAG